MMEKYKPIMIISFAIAGGCAFLSGLIGQWLFSVAMIPLFVGIFAFIKFAKGKSELKRLENTICKSCGAKFRYPDNVKYVIKDTSVITSNLKDGIKSTTKTKVEIMCHCSECGNENTFEWIFITEEKLVNAFGAVLSQKSYSLDDWVADLFE